MVSSGLGLLHDHEPDNLLFEVICCYSPRINWLHNNQSLLVFRTNWPVKGAVSRPAGLWGLNRQAKVRATGRRLRTCTEKTIHLLHLETSLLTQSPLLCLRTAPPPPPSLCWRRMEALTRTLLWREKPPFLRVRIYYTYKSKAVHIQNTVIYSVCMFMFQCQCLETENLSIFLLLKALHLNSVTPLPAKSLCLLSQSGTAAHPDRSDTQTCSGQHNPMGQQTQGQTASTKTTILINWASTTAWKSCRRFTHQRRTASLPGCSWRLTHTAHGPQSEITWAR